MNSILRKLRRDNELTQEKVAAAIGLKYAAYNHYETGRATPPPDKVEKLAELYGVTTDYLLGREGGTVAEDSKGYADNLDAMGCKLAYHEIMQRLTGHPRKTAEFRRCLETFKEEHT